ncbi:MULTISPECIES: molybdopterin-dependent oxidoreductase [unclassified Methylobacterium]|uniref:molybdopterin-dependent oxidoreductase n=1 Tax=unclassified Methylobacterium TaxID=2615210 RepID=UPI0006F1C8F7|nr:MULTISPECIES: molybdopterin-dependent oxidoreductase [unclassified Methylobacterium]KQO60472.1 molybdopterin-binding protein [Methylobacterium sp. Leaf86]KQP00213.1 molybdopterin-binding protein [Methylobacterium sp. Leaf91]
MSRDENEAKRLSGLRREIQPELVKLERRLFLRSGLSLGALSLLSGCDLSTGANGTVIDRALWAMSRANDRVQAWLFDPNTLAPTYPASMIDTPFRFNAYYPPDNIPEIDEATWKLDVGGLVADKTPWTLQRLRALPQESQITRHICIEGWSQIGQWSGVPLRSFLERVGADLTAKYVGFKCADRYYGSLDMPSALHPQTVLALDFGGVPLPLEYGYPLRVRVPTKLGFKSPKHIVSVFATNDDPGGYWEDQGYNWFSGI